MDSQDYSVDYFISKFKSIKKRFWGTGSFSYKWLWIEKQCAMGHCESASYVSHIKPKNECGELIKLFKLINLEVWRVNDGCVGKYYQRHPKERILAALYDIKKLQEQTLPQPIPEETKQQPRIVYVTINETIKEESKELVNQLN